jgi:hypothetical protein
MLRGLLSRAFAINWLNGIHAHASLQALLGGFPSQATIDSYPSFPRLEMLEVGWWGDGEVLVEPELTRSTQSRTPSSLLISRPH